MHAGAAKRAQCPGAAGLHRGSLASSEPAIPAHTSGLLTRYLEVKPAFPAKRFASTSGWGGPERMRLGDPQ